MAASGDFLMAADNQRRLDHVPILMYHRVGPGLVASLAAT
jgi:hypothetical protein